MECSIVNFGARADSKLCTSNIQKAIDECFLSGGGEVIVPAGKYVVAGLRLRSNVTLRLLENACLIGSKNPEDYYAYLEDEIEPIPKSDYEMVVSTSISKSRSVQPYSRWNNAIIRAINAENVAIIGEKGSIIDGRNCYDEQGEENYRGPHGINIWFCKNVTLKGYTLKDTGNWAHAIQNSQDIKVDGITVLGGHDGFDVRTCDDVLVENSEFYTGDDCIAGFDNIKVTVKNCILNCSCNVLRFGGTDVLVENCKGFGPGKYAHRYNLSIEKKRAGAETDENCRNNALAVLSYYCDNRANIRKTPGNFIFKNCEFDTVDQILSLPFGHVWCCNRSLSNLTFQNCSFKNVSLSSYVRSPENEPISLSFGDCVISARKDFENQPLLDVKNFDEISFNTVKIENFTSPKIVTRTQGQILVKDGTPIETEFLVEQE